MFMGCPNISERTKGVFFGLFHPGRGIRKRKRVRLGQIPLAQAKKVLAQHMQEIVEKKFLAVEKPKPLSTRRRIPSWLIPGKKENLKNDAQMVGRLKAFFGTALEKLNAGHRGSVHLTKRRKEGNCRLTGKALKTPP